MKTWEISISPKKETQTGTKTESNVAKQQIKKTEKNSGKNIKTDFKGKSFFTFEEIEISPGKNKMQAGGNAEKKLCKSVEPAPRKNCCPTKNLRLMKIPNAAIKIYVNGFIAKLKKYLFKIYFIVIFPWRE